MLISQEEYNRMMLAIEKEPNMEKYRKIAMELVDRTKNKVTEQNEYSLLNTIYDQIGSLRQAMAEFYTGEYWYIGWGVSVLLIATLCMFPNVNITQNSESIDSLVKRIESIEKKKIENAWEIAQKKPKLLREIAAKLYETTSIPIVKKIENKNTIIGYRSTKSMITEIKSTIREIATELVETIKLNQKESKEHFDYIKQIVEQLEYLKVLYKEMEKNYEKIQPRIDQLEAKSKSKLINQDIKEKFVDEIINKL